MPHPIRLAVLAALAGIAAPTAHAALVISSAPTQNVNCYSARSYIYCYVTMPNAALNVSDLESKLTLRKLYINSAGNSLLVEAPIHWANSTELILAGNGVFIDRKISVDGQGSLGLEGQLSFGPKGRVDFAKKTSRLSVGGIPFALASSLLDMTKAIAKGNNDVALIGDYDASSDGTYSQAPVIGASRVEGLGHRISNVGIVVGSSATSRGIGVFSDPYSVADLDVRHIDITVPGNISAGSVGGVAGSVGYVSGVTVSGSVRAPSLTGGGLVGTLNGDLTRSAAHVRVIGAVAGGLVGKANGSIELCSASGNVTAAHATAGGLVGVLANNNISQSFATGNVTTRSGKILIGGGLVGTQESGGYITNSYAFGTVTAADGYLGGLIGFMEQSKVEASYATGAAGPTKYGAGVVGHNMYADISNAYWDITTSGNRKGAATGSQSNIIGLTDAQLKSALPTGFDPGIWAENPMVNNGYPYLIANPPQ